MLRKVIAASLVLVLTVSVAFAERIRAVITKVEGDKVTFAPLEGRGKEAKKGDEKTMTVAKDIKVIQGRQNKETKKFEGEEVEGGLKHKMFTNIKAKGIRGTIVTDADKITEIRLFKRK